MEGDMDLTSLLETIASCRVADEPFAEAYARLPLKRRGQIKSLIAWHAQRHGLGDAAVRREALFSAQGAMTSFNQLKPCALALVILGPGFDSPARLAAAILPPLCASVGRVAVVSLVEDPAVRVHAADSFPVPDPLLAVLELAGVEDAYVLGMDEGQELATAMASRQDIRLLYLPRAGEGQVFPFGRETVEPHWIGQVSGPAGLWTGKGGAWDLEGLAYFHPDLELHLWGPEPLSQELPGAMRATMNRGSAEDFLREKGRSIIFATKDVAGRCLGLAPLAAGPGREWFWFWPDLTRERFLVASEAAFAPGTLGKESGEDGDAGSDAGLGDSSVHLELP